MNQEQPPPYEPGSQPGDIDPFNPQVPMARPVCAPDELPVARALAPEPFDHHNPMRLDRLPVWLCLINLVAVVAAFLFSSFVVGLAISARDGFDPENPTASITILDMVPIGLLTVLFMLLLLRLERVPLAAIGLSGFNLHRGSINALLGFAATAIAFGLFAISVIVMRWVWPEGAAQFENNTQNIDRMIPRVAPLTLLVVMAGVGLYEEIVFRGILLTHLRRIFRSWTAAVLVSGMAFGLVHIGGDVHQVEAAAIPLGLVGMAWSIITIWRRSLLPAILSHILFNFVQVMILFQMAPQPGPTSSSPAPGLGLIRLGRSLACAAGFC